MDKTQAIIFGTSRYINMLDYTNLPRLGNTQHSIEFESSVRNLGILMDSKLTFTDHLAHITRKINSSFYQLYHVSTFANQALKKLLVSALILPNINYCLAVLNGVEVVIDLKLQRLMNRAVRYVVGCRRDDPISQHRREHSWLSVSSLRKYFIATITYGALNTDEPQYLKELILANTSTGRTRLAINQGLGALTVPKYRTDTFMYSFAVTAPIIWNSIPISIKDNNSPFSLKFSLKQWLLALKRR